MTNDTKLQEISIAKILANFEQPREKFDKEQIRELAESILSNGLINPIIVREYKGDRYMIVAGERRWQAHKVAGLKTIRAFIKKYKNDGEWMVESLIENVHREDLSPTEKGKYCLKIMQLEKIDNISQLSKRIASDKNNVIDWIEDYKLKKRGVVAATTSHTLIRATKGMKDSERKEVIKFAEKNEVPARQIEERIIPIINKAQNDVKKALFDDKINVEQAERISKLSSEKDREKAIEAHQKIKVMDKQVVAGVELSKKMAEKRLSNKEVIQVKNWILSFRGSVTDTRENIEKNLKLLAVCLKLLDMMDDKQKNEVKTHLSRLSEILGRAEEVTDKVLDRLK